MKTEDKELLLRDLSGRLPYGVKCKIHTHVHGDTVYKLTDIRDNGYTCGTVKDKYAWAVLDISGVKPYLFPFSSMNKEQKREYHQSTSKDIDMLQDVILERINGEDNTNKHAIAYNGIDWLNAHHFDYRGLIKKGLAIDATGLNIYKEG